MIAIIIKRHLTKKEIRNIQKKINPNVIIYREDIVPDYFSDQTTTHLIPNNDETKKKINHDIMDQVLLFGETKINNITITDLFSYNSMSIWHYSKFRTYFLARDLFYEISLLKEFERKYKQIYYFGRQKFIKPHFINSKILFIFSNSETNKFNYFQIFKYFLFFSTRVFIGFFQKLSLHKKEHIVIDHSAKQKVLDINTLKEENSNYNLYYLFALLDKNFVILDDVNLPEKKSSYKFQLKRWQLTSKGKIFGEYILFKGLFSSRTRREAKSIANKLKLTFDSIDTSQISMTQKTIFEYFKSSYSSLILYVFKYVAYKNFFNKHSFKSIASIDENSPRIKSILDAAKANKIITIGIQHGNIGDLSPAYLFTQQDIKKNISAKHTLVWGNYWREFLQKKANYKPTSLHITGQIRTDIIPKLLKNEIEIPELKNINKRIILFASQPQRDEFIRRKAAEDVFTSVKNQKDCFLVIKLHPAELDDFNYYHEIAKSVGCTNYIILYWTDLYLILLKSDIVITCFSTVGTEAIYFNKPLIILDHLKQDIQNYKKEGVAFQATNDIELTMLIQKLNSGEISFDQNSYRQFVQKYAYKIDGKSSARVLNLIKHL